MRIAHADFDGVVSAIFLGLEDVEIRDYSEVPRRPLPGAVIVEVYHPENVDDTTIVIDHHAPKVRAAPSLSLEGYALCGRRLCWRAGTETPSMVRGVHLLAAGGVRLPGVEPRPVPEPIIAVADALDNAVEPPRWALRSLGVSEEPGRVLLGLFATPEGEYRRMLRELYEGGLGDPAAAVARFLRDAAAYADSPPPRPFETRVAGWLVLIGWREEVRYWGLAAQLRGETRVAMVSEAGGSYTVTLYSRGREALEAARRMGGGGRRTWGRPGYIAGFQAERLMDVVRALKAARHRQEAVGE